MNRKQNLTILKLLIESASLKDVKRTGWVVRGVKNPESVADHSWGVLLLALLLTDRDKLDKNRVLKMAIVHDLGEIVPGDVRWEEGTKIIGSQVKKRKRELDTVKNLFKDYPDNKEYVDLLQEFNEQNTAEARFLKKIEKLEMVIQAFIYEKQKRNNESLEEFWDNAEKYLKESELEALFNELKSMRK